MFVLFAIGVGICIVAGQALWKLAVQHVTRNQVTLSSAHGISKLLMSPYLLAGVIVYGVATLAYILLLSKFKYFQVQSIVVGSSLIFTFILSSLFFKEPASLINVIGVVLIVGGAVLIIK